MGSVVSLKEKLAANASTQKYKWSVELEKQFLLALVCNHSLWESVGKHLDVTAAHCAETKTIHQVLVDHVKRFGRTPSTLQAFLTHLSTLHEHDCKVHKDDHDRVVDFLLEEPEMSVDDVRDQAAVHVRQRRRMQVLDLIDDANAKNLEVKPLVQDLLEVEEIGLVTNTRAETIDDPNQFFDLIAQNRTACRVTTGIPQVDLRLEGGPVRSTLTTFGAASGAGKSWVLHQAACANLIQQRRVIYIDCEMGALPAYTRIVGWLTGLGEQEVNSGSEEAKRRWAIVKNNIGPLSLHYMPPGTSVFRLRQHVELVRNTPEFGGGFDVLILDYGDRLVGSPSDRNSHEQFGTVWEVTRNIAVQSNAWAFTASQLKATDGDKDPTWEDLAGSRKKGEISDYVVCLWKDDEDAEMRTFKVSKARRAPESERTELIMSELDKCRVVRPQHTLDHLF